MTPAVDTNIAPSPQHLPQVMETAALNNGRTSLKYTFPYNRAAKAVMEESGVLKNKVNWRSRKVPAKDADLLSLANLKDIATAIHLGVTRGPKALDRQVIGQSENQQKLQKQLLEFFDKFLPSCRSHYGFLENPIKPQDRGPPVQAGVLRTHPPHHKALRQHLGKVDGTARHTADTTAG